MDIRSRTANSSTMFESLEPRLLLSSSPALIAEALDLPAGVVVAYTGNDLAAQDRIQYATGGLLGIPTGPDEDFLMLSTGDAAQIDTLDNEAESQGTDLGAAGEAGDVVTVQFTLPVPASEPAGRQQKLKLDFIFLTEEVQEWRGTAYNDYFKVTVNGDEIANLNINSALLDDTLDTTGTFFDSRTDRLTAVYVIPGGAATLDVTVELGDVGDGWYDSGVLLDNVRIEGDELVWLNFDGMDVGEHFGWGTGTTLPAFQPRDVRSTELRNTLIANILAGVEDKYADYDITFVTAQPASGDYSTVVIGGSGETMTHLEPILQTLKALPANVTLDDYYGQEGLLGLADGIDFGNVDKNSLSVVLSGEFENFGDNAVRNLTEVIAHELGHTLGLRHVTDDNDIMYPWWDFGREDFAGEDTFTYTIMDEDGLTDTATVTVLVGEPQEPYDDEAVIEKDSAPTAIDVLANDLHPDPTEVLTIESVAQPSHGTVEIINGGAELTYQPDAEYVGDDSFTYNVIDEDGLLAGSATVTITVMADEPIANDDGAEVLVDSGPVAVAVLDNDTHLNPTENLTITSVTQGANGTVVITGGGTGLTYEPDAAYTGDDEFTYTIEDEAGLSATATVSMDVGHVADAPTAYDDDAAVEQGSEPVAIDVLVNDTYLPDLPETLTIVSVTQGSHGEVVITGGGTGLTYQPDSLTFQDENMSLQEDWADGATGQNDYDYFADVLGLAGGGTSPVENHTAVTGEIIRTFNISFPSTLYNVTFGTTGSGQTVHFDTLNGTRHLSLPVYSPNDQVFLFASTRPDGRINVVSGTVVVDPEAPPQDWSIIGTLDYDGIMIDLYDGVEMIGEFPLAKLRINGTFEQILKRSGGGVWNNKAVGISESRYYAAAGVDWLARNRGAFEDDDGDTYNVALTGDGTVA
ncbi:MAG: Ig-like domain-containing protein, partial [Planctomycetota bacterium]|nr:Ig-like domain-containing protein [Planctomycetota bacterium]